MKKTSAILLPLLFCSSCATAPSSNQHLLRQRLTTQKNLGYQHCDALFSETERSIAKAGVVDSEAARIAGYPYLRVNRFLASYRHEANGKQFEAWIDQLKKLAFEGLQVEIRNLPASTRQQLQDKLNHDISAPATLIEALQQCAGVMQDETLDEKIEQDSLRKKAIVPSEYNLWQRLAGLYPLTAPMFRLGIKHWHEQTLVSYSQPLSKLRIMGKLVRHIPEQKKTPLSFANVAKIIKLSSRNPLNIPLPSAEQKNQLFEQFTPIFEIDTVTENDQFGTPKWQIDGKPAVDTSKPMVYRHLSHSRLGDQALLQLNYTIWFPSRPKNSALDLLGGQLDGITWRVTLLPDGKPWLFDAIHNCGCYHLFFPTRYAQKTEQGWWLDEPAFIPQQPVTVNENEQTIVRIASASHYIERIYSSAAITEGEYHYQSTEASNLRSLALADGHRRSLFSQDGIVVGTERGERFIFWPMGIPNPGAMRQWGHHATAFVGSRHFDDPRLLENNFKRIQPEK